MSALKIQSRDPETGNVSEIDLYNNTVTMRDENGALVTMDLGVADVHIDSALANVAFGFRMADSIADQVAPVVMTAKASDKYWKWDKDDVFQQVDNLVVAPGGSINEVSPRLSSSPFSTVPYALQAFVPTEVEANADSPLRPRMAATKRLMNALMLGREVRVAAAARLATNYGSAYKAAIAAGAKWNGGATSDPVRDLLTRCEATLLPVKKIIMSERTSNAFVQNASVQKYIATKSSVPGLPSNEQLTSGGALLRLPPIEVSSMKYKSTASAYDYVWGNDVVLLHPAPQVSDGQDTGSLYTYRWTGADNGMDLSMQGGFFVRTYFDPKRGPRGGTVIVVGHNDAEVFTSDVVSGLLTDAYQ